MWFFGSIIGSSMGALLARPTSLWPVLKGTIFDAYPYFLPNLVAAIFVISAVILGAFFLKETRVLSRSTKDISGSENTETSPLLVNGHGDEQDRQNSSAAPVEGIREAQARTEDSTPLSSTRMLDETTIKDTASDTASSPCWNRNMVLLILQLSLASYLQMVYGVLMPIYLVDAPSPEIPTGHLDLRGGFGLTVRQVGGVMSANGLAAIIVQGVIFTPFVSKVGVWKSFVWLTIMAPLPYFVVPFITMVPRSHGLTAIYMDLFAQNFMNIMVYPCLLILLKDSTPSVSILGQVNGVAMTCCSGARTIAPPLVGYIYGLGGSAAGWWSIVLVAMIAGALVPTIKRPVSSQNSEVDNDGV